MKQVYYDYDVYPTVFLGDREKTVTVQPNETSFTVELTGNGKTEFQVSADGIPLNDIPKAVIEFAE